MACLMPFYMQQVGYKSSAVSQLSLFSLLPSDVVVNSKMSRFFFAGRIGDKMFASAISA